MLSLKGKTIFISGASSGIGMACAKTCADLGARLILLARREARLLALADELNTDCYCLTADVRDRTAIENAIASLPADWQRIDGLINNAGLAAGLSSIQAADVDDWEQMIDTNLKGLLYLCRAITPRMIEQDAGHIINIGSIAGHEVYPNGAVYCATKHAVNAFTRGLKMDLLGTQIRVSEIAPGMVDTEFSLVRFKGDQSRAEKVYEGMTPLQANDIADACAYCLTRPTHVNVSQMIVLATDQSAATLVARQKGE